MTDLENVVVKLLEKAVIELPADVKNALRKAKEKETNRIGKLQLSAILENIEMAESKRIPMCQDTGALIFYLGVGTKYKGDMTKVNESIRKGVERATKEVPLRPNMVTPLGRKNTKTNTGMRTPYAHYSLLQGKDYIEMTVLPKGAGSENMSALLMMKPTEGVAGVKKFVIDAVTKAGGKPCPPTIIGIGIGGSSDIALTIAKEALMRPITDRNPDPDIAKLERELFEELNKTGVGPMGLGGDTTVLGVNIELADVHTASLPVGLNMGCWANRMATARIYESGKVEFL